MTTISAPTVDFPSFDEFWEKYPVENIYFYDMVGAGETEITPYDEWGESLYDLDLPEEFVDDVMELEQELFYIAGDAAPKYFAIKGVVTRNLDGTYTFTMPHVKEAYTSPRK